MMTMTMYAAKHRKEMMMLREKGNHRPPRAIAQYQKPRRTLEETDHRPAIIMKSYCSKGFAFNPCIYVLTGESINSIRFHIN